MKRPPPKSSANRPGPRRPVAEKREKRTRKDYERLDSPVAPRPLREDLITQACLEAYGSVRHEGRMADRALDFTLRSKRNLYSNERRAVAERVYALLRRQRTVDFLLEHARSGFENLGATQKDLLRLATSRVLVGDSLSRVAREMALDAEDAAAMERLGEAAAKLQALPREQRFPIAASLPDFLAARFLAELGDEAEAAAEAMNERAPLNARTNTLKTTREELRARLLTEEVDARTTVLSPLGLALETRVNVFGMAAFKDGLFELQDEGSQLLGMLVDPPPTKVVDACAGAGGKTLQLAAEMKNRGELFALDVEEGRMEDLRKRARRAGVHNVRTRLIPADNTAKEALEDLVGKADRVLVDAPCSGTGTFRRKPDGRYRMTEADLAFHVSRQKELLARFAVLVKPGGRLIYGTCSILREENEAVVEDFLAHHPDFSLKPASEQLGPELGPKVTRDGYLRLSPHRHGTDGFFGAILVRSRQA